MYAGKTVYIGTVYDSTLEHPRVCGENWRSPRHRSRPGGTSPRMRENLGHATLSRVKGGTSPRMRGKPQADRSEVYPGRNIPAYAGKTPTHGLSPLAAAEHPRVCGENKPTGTWHSPVTGTSPRMRGKPILTERQGDQHRNIPAYAGKTG